MIPSVDPAVATHWAHMAGQLAGIGYWWMDASTQAIRWSPNMYKIFGLTPGVVPSLEYAMQLVHPEDRERANANLANNLAGGTSPSVTRIVRPSGEVRYVEGRNGCEFGADGEVLAIYGTMIDVTEYKLAQHALTDSERRYRLLVENATDITACVSPDGAYKFLTPSILTLLGYEVSELIGCNVADVIHPDDIERVRKEFRQYLRQGPGAAPARIEYRAIAKDGREVWVEGHPRGVFDASGALVEIQDVVRDISCRKALEQDLTAAKERAESATAVKAEFLSNISHELRTPLTAIIGYSGLLSETPDLPEQVRKQVDRVDAASRTLLSLINGILDFSRLEAGRVTISPRICSPAQIARESLELVALQAEAKAIQLEYFEAGVPQSLIIDPDAYRQVLANLIGNAVKFTDSGFVRLTVEFNASGDQLFVTVEDSGVGIEQAQQDKLFQRFSQIDGSSTRTHHGAGLGLAICKGLVEAMAGEISVMSEPGVGSIFTFRIPASRASELVRPDEIAQMPLPGSRILVADDNSSTRELVRAILQTCGAEVVEAADGAAAIDAATTQPFDLILLDLRMPHVEGREVAARLRAKRGPNANIPIIAFTASGEALENGFCETSGFDDALTKPVAPRDLLAMVARHTSPQGEAA